MQAKATKHSRSRNAQEIAFQGYVKGQPCVACGDTNISDFEHIVGGMTKTKYNYQTVQIGHLFGVSLCRKCHDLKTNGSRRNLESIKEIDLKQKSLELLDSYPGKVCEITVNAIKEYKYI